ncbi:MAG: hypothetical protein JOZ69_04575 [Myxococcales bacterium]|nr:hypothetical protein [Myxococcales bacterium]
MTRSPERLAGPLVFAAAVLLPHQAFARDCTTSTDCPAGFFCVPTGVGPDGAAISTCFSGQCQGDSDCAAGFRCIFGLGSICTTAADGGSQCQPNNVCAPQWEVPCTEASGGMAAA